jgi:hypothetical protein
MKNKFLMDGYSFYKDVLSKIVSERILPFTEKPQLVKIQPGYSAFKNDYIIYVYYKYSDNPTSNIKITWSEYKAAERDEKLNRILRS